MHKKKYNILEGWKYNFKYFPTFTLKYKNFLLFKSVDFTYY